MVLILEESAVKGKSSNCVTKSPSRLHRSPKGSNSGQEHGREI